MHRSFLLTCLLPVLAACGTTVPLGASAADGGSRGLQTGSGTGAVQQGMQSLGSAATRTTGSSTTKGFAASGAARASQGRSSAAGVSTAVGGSAVGGSVPGMTATTVKLGFEYLSTASVSTYATTAGVKGVGQVDGLAAYRAVVAAVNGAGGVAGGRKVDLVVRNRSLSESNAQAAQASCSAFTDDSRVLAAAAFSYEGSSQEVDCLAAHGVLSIGAGQPEAGSQTDFTHYAGRYVAPDTADTITGARAYVDGLVRQGFLTPHSTIGLLWFNFADYVAARADGLIPALKAYGMSIKSDFQATYDGNPEEGLGQVAAQMQNATLQFRTASVDRVLALDYQGTLDYLFMTNAQQQGYHPLYGLAGWSDDEFLRANAPAAQLTGAAGIGWLPYYDVQVSQQPTSKATARCAAAMKAANLPPEQAQTDVLIEDEACATVFYLADLLNSTHDFTPAGLAAAAAALGARPSYAGFADSYSGAKFWGAAAYRDIAYGTACACFTYSGPLRPFN